MKTEILKIKGSWQDIVNDCRSTVGKAELGKDPSTKFKKSILIAEHGPIRSMSVRFRWASIPSWVATHFSRHKWECFVQTQRNDRQDNYDRNKAPQDSPVIFVGDMNCQNAIDTARKRLCRLASPETREHMEDFKKTLRPIETELSDVLVPNCVYRCGCPEQSTCGYYDALCKINPAIMSTNIQERYDAYNEIFYRNETK